MRQQLEEEPEWVFDPSNQGRSGLSVGLQALANCDAVIFDGRKDCTLSAAAELMAAKRAGVPIVACCPPTSPHRHASDISDNNWIEPVVFELCDHVAINLAEAGAWLDGLFRARARQAA